MEAMPNPMSVRILVTQVLQSVAAQQNRDLSPLSDGLRLVDCGLDSLALAIVVSRLDAELGVDPFVAEREFEVPETFGDLVRSYQAIVGN